MGVMYALDIFQNKILIFTKGLEFVRTYLDDPIYFSRGSFTKHILDVEYVLDILCNDNLKVDTAKESFGKTEIEYLRYIVSREGNKPQPKNIEVIIKIVC